MDNFDITNDIDNLIIRVAISELLKNKSSFKCTKDGTEYKFSFDNDGRDRVFIESNRTQTYIRLDSAWSLGGPNITALNVTLSDEYKKFMNEGAL